MKVLVVYDSVYGNTEKIARAISDAIGADASLVRAGEAHPSDLGAFDLLVVGSPTQGFRPTAPVQSFILGIPGSLKGKKVAAFDTRIPPGGIGFIFRAVVKLGGYAAPRIARSLQKKGGNLIARPEGFYVMGMEGPLKDGETERAAAWARAVLRTPAVTG